LFEIATVQVAAEEVTLATTMLVTRLTVPAEGVKPVSEVEPLYVHATDTEVFDGITYAELP
jgi:hypothetical protein